MQSCHVLNLHSWKPQLFPQLSFFFFYGNIPSYIIEYNRIEIISSDVIPRNISSPPPFYFRPSRKTISVSLSPAFLPLLFS